MCAVATVSTLADMDDQQLLDSSVRLPSHVLFRPVEDEGMMLDLETEAYLGLNPSGRVMLEVALESDTVRAGLTELESRFDAPAERLRADLVEFVRTLSERGLIEIAAPVSNDVG